LPSVEIGCRIAKVLGVSVEYLVTGVDPYEEEAPDEDDKIVSAPAVITPGGKTYSFKDEDVVMVPILSQKVSAGHGQDWHAEALETGETLPVLKRLVKMYSHSLLRVVEVRGDSMTGVHMFDGDMAIFVDKLVRRDGIYVVAIHGELYVKRLEFDPIENRIKVISENPKYEAKQVPADTEILQICGKVVGWVHSHPY